MAEIWRKNILIFSIILLALLTLYAVKPEMVDSERIKGVNFVAPPNPITQKTFLPILEINSNWVAIVPYAFCWPNRPDIYYNVDNQWWGEKTKGVVASIQYAKNLGLKVMVKPHMWVVGDGWAGDYQLEEEEQWKYWEEDYMEYILHYAHIADSLDVELFCIGTEYRQAVQARQAFWSKLIEKTRLEFNGELTYAANWDNYHNVTFWQELDYIGIDAYFPLSESKTPSVDELVEQWDQHVDELDRLSVNYQKPIIFTEYGYRSTDFTANGHWNMEDQDMSPNMEAQKNAYQALFSALEEKAWFKGGFLWKWFAHHANAGGPKDSKFTPQNKPAQEVIKKWHTQ